ncbi:hypothetical protein HY605_01590 [Candidatus Peregrinibacteria bacterium]|nr:hypothetical protein [Candidatus Peregrinibacteria bacterium]
MVNVCCGTPDEYGGSSQPSPNEGHGDGDSFPVVYSYTRKQAIEDGILVPLGHIDGMQIIFTTNLYFSENYDKDEPKRKELISRGLAMLAQPDPEDTNSMKIRVIEKGKIWVIQDGDGITFMKPEDY